MNEFYDYIVNITKTSGYQNILTKDSEIIMDAILNDYQENIKIAAAEGRNEAYIFIYEVNAKIKNISVDAYVRMNNPKVVEKFNEFKLEPVMERIQKKISPFKVEIRPIDNSNYFAIVVSWVNIV